MHVQKPNLNMARFDYMHAMLLFLLLLHASFPPFSVCCFFATYGTHFKNKPLFAKNRPTPNIGFSLPKYDYAQNINFLSQNRPASTTTLDFPYLSCLKNNPIHYAPFCPPIPAKLSSNFPKCDVKLGEDTKNHVMTFHPLHSYKSLVDDSI
jgi:hypothetical protein